MKQILQQLPRVNRDLIEALVKPLWVIAQNSAVNSMNASNLGIAFGPSLLPNPVPGKGSSRESTSSGT
jgi:hypothetical protein